MSHTIINLVYLEMLTSYLDRRFVVGFIYEGTVVDFHLIVISTILTPFIQ